MATTDKCSKDSWNPNLPLHPPHRWPHRTPPQPLHSCSDGAPVAAWCSTPPAAGCHAAGVAEFRRPPARRAAPSWHRWWVWCRRRRRIAAIQCQANCCPGDGRQPPAAVAGEAAAGDDAAAAVWPLRPLPLQPPLLSAAQNGRSPWLCNGWRSDGCACCCRGCPPKIPGSCRAAGEPAEKDKRLVRRCNFLKLMRPVFF